MKVKECMCNDVCVVKPETTINEVAKLMGEYHIGCIPVCDENNSICGIITDRDILLRAIASEKDTKNCPISDIMTTNVCTCTENEDITNAENKMSEYQIRRLPVCDTNNKVIGILTTGDLAHNTKKIGNKEICDTIKNICNCDGQTKNAE